MKKSNILTACIIIVAAIVAVMCCHTMTPKNQTAELAGDISAVTTKVNTPSVDPADQKALMEKISGLWLNKCKSASRAYSTAHAVGLTDVSMTEFVTVDGECFMTTMGDIKGQYDGGKVPNLQDEKISFTYVAPDLSRAKGKVAGMKITLDLSKIEKKRLSFKCGKYKNHCAATGFNTAQEMFDFMEGGNE